MVELSVQSAPEQCGMAYRLFFGIGAVVKDQINDSIIHTQQLGSDHCPVELQLNE